MGIRHPDDRKLVRYLSLSLNQEEAEAVARHIEECKDCAHRQSAWRGTIRRMDGFVQDEPSAPFTERVMAALPPAFGHPVSTGWEESPRRIAFLRPELAHALLATAATYLFLSTGIVQRLYTLDAGAVQAGLYTKMTVLLDWVGQLARNIPS